MPDRKSQAITAQKAIMQKSDNGTFAPQLMGFVNPEPKSLWIQRAVYNNSRRLASAEFLSGIKLKKLNHFCSLGQLGGGDRPDVYKRIRILN